MPDMQGGRVLEMRHVMSLEVSKSSITLLYPTYVVMASSGRASNFKQHADPNIGDVYRHVVDRDHPTSSYLSEEIIIGGPENAAAVEIIFRCVRDVEMSGCGSGSGSMNCLLKKLPWSSPI